MKLRAKIERRDKYGYKLKTRQDLDFVKKHDYRGGTGIHSVTFTFPAGTERPYVRESITERNIGPRPWAEIFFTNDKGEKVKGYCKMKP